MSRAYPAKRPGSCVCCGTETYEIRERVTDPDSPLHGTPSRLGPMLEQGCQIEFLMSDGSEASIACCLDCALEIRPPDYQRIWQTCIDAADFYARGRSTNERVYLLRQQMAVWPIALVRKRREGAPWRGQPGLVIDRR